MLEQGHDSEDPYHPPEEGRDVPEATVPHVVDLDDRGDLVHNIVNVCREREGDPRSRVRVRVRVTATLKREVGDSLNIPKKP